MNDEQPTLKVVDRRPFNPDGSPRELSPEEKEATEQAAAEFSRAAAADSAPRPTPPAPAVETAVHREPKPTATAPR